MNELIFTFPVSTPETARSGDSFYSVNVCVIPTQGDDDEIVNRVGVPLSDIAPRIDRDEKIRRLKTLYCDWKEMIQTMYTKEELRFDDVFPGRVSEFNIVAKSKRAVTDLTRAQTDIVIPVTFLAIAIRYVDKELCGWNMQHQCLEVFRSLVLAGGKHYRREDTHIAVLQAINIARTWIGKALQQSNTITELQMASDYMDKVIKEHEQRIMKLEQRASQIESRVSDIETKANVATEEFRCLVRQENEEFRAELREELKDHQVRIAAAIAGHMPLSSLCVPQKSRKRDSPSDDYYENYRQKDKKRNLEQHRGCFVRANI